MMALLLTKVKAYNLNALTSVQLLSRTSAELTIEGKPVVILSPADMTLTGLSIALTQAVEFGKPVTEDELGRAAVEASSWRA